MNQLLNDLSKVQFVIDESEHGQKFQSRATAFELAKGGKLRLDCANFATLLLSETFEQSIHFNEPFTYCPGLQTCYKETLNNVLFMCPLDIKGCEVDVSSHGQWIVKPFYDDDRWVGLTNLGVEAKTINEWLMTNSDMIYDALQLDNDEEFVKEAALYSEEWAFRKIIPEEREVKSWTVLRPPPRHRVRTRQFIKKEITRVRDRIEMEKKRKYGRAFL